MEQHRTLFNWGVFLKACKETVDPVDFAETFKAHAIVPYPREPQKPPIK